MENNNHAELHQLNLDQPSTSTQTSGGTDSAPQFDTHSRQEPAMNRSSKLPLLLAVVAVTAGIGTGFGGARLSKGGSVLTPNDGGAPMQRVAGDSVNNGDVFGVQDEKTFKDSAEGYLEIGGIDGEGSHRLLRAGGVSQTVYLTSSVTDLSRFKGMHVKVWGETNKGQKAGWLMDVGRVQVIETSAQPPAEE